MYVVLIFNTKKRTTEGTGEGERSSTAYIPCQGTLHRQSRGYHPILVLHITQMRGWVANTHHLALLKTLTEGLFSSINHAGERKYTL